MAKLGVLVILVAACSGEVDTAPQAIATTTIATTTATTAPSTSAPATTAAMASHEFLLTFDGGRCIYEGPSEGDVSEPVTLTLVNDSDLFAFGVVTWVPPHLVEEVMAPVGTDFPFGEDVEGMRDTFNVEVPSGGEQSLTGLSFDPGTYVLERVSAEGATMVHIWHFGDERGCDTVERPGRWLRPSRPRNGSRQPRFERGTSTPLAHCRISADRAYRSRTSRFHSTK